MALFRKRDDDDEGKKSQPSSSGDEQGLNREMKRMMKKREGAADRLRRVPPARKKRTKPREFIREVRGELGRVAWPTRTEVVTYTIVVLVSVAFFMTIIFGLDSAFVKVVLLLYNKGGG